MQAPKCEDDEIDTVIMKRPEHWRPIETEPEPESAQDDEPTVVRPQLVIPPTD